MSNFARTLSIVVMFVFILAVPAIGQTSGTMKDVPGDKPSVDEQATDNTGEEKNGKEGKEEEEKKEPDFEKITKDLEVIEGLFTFYRDNDKGTVYLGIKPEQLDIIYLLSPTLESGVGEKGLRGTTMMSERPIIFHRETKGIQLIEVNTLFRADDPGLEKMIKKMYSDSVLGRTKIEAERKSDGMILIDLGKVFITDFPGLSKWINYRFDGEDSHFGVLKAFPKNVNIAAYLAFATDSPPDSITLPDARSLTLQIIYDISERPNDGYIPRYADQRIGYFTTTFMDFSDDRNPERYRYYINRWHLEKKYPDRAVSPPKEPIVFWLEDTIPEKYKPALRDGIMMWNDAFKRIGIENAIEVRDMPADADWDPADVRYNVIRWFWTYNNVFAIGPSRVDPFTGEIYDADIGVSVDFPHSYYYGFLTKINIFDNAKPMDDVNLVAGLVDGRYDCDYAEELAKYNFNALNILRARGVIKPGSKEEDEYAYAGIKALICHEVGHTLGLRHNYKASRCIPTSKLNDVEFTKVHGLVSSIMEYDVPNIAPPGVKQGEYFSSTVGDYDRWAIEYGYSDFGAKSPDDEVDALNEIASQGAERFHLYGTDEDAHWGTISIDPLAVSWDMGDDPFAYYEGSIANTQELLGRLEEYWDVPETDYKYLRSTFGAALGEYANMGRTLMRYIGGIYHNRFKVGDPNSEPPYVPVPGAEQRRAISFFDKYLWSEDAFNFDPAMLNKLGKSYNQGFDYSGDPRQDLAIGSIILGLQTQPLNWMYDPIVLTRISDMAEKYPEDSDPFYLSDLFPLVRDDIWGEVKTGENINPNRRDLQLYHLNILVNLVVHTPDGAPSDAKSLARMDLVYLQDAIEKDLVSNELDYMTRSHLGEVEAEIKAALEAEFNF